MSAASARSFMIGPEWRTLVIRPEPEIGSPGGMSGRRRLFLRVSHKLAKVELGGLSDVHVELTLHQLQRLPIGLRVLGDGAIGGHMNLEVPHVGVCCGEEDTVVAGNSRHDHSACFEVLEKNFERRRMKRGVARFQYEIVAT